MAARLLTAHASSVGIAHEALLGAWPRLHTWIDDVRDQFHVHRQATEATRIWLDNDRDPSALVSGARLDLLRPLQTDAHPDLNLTRSERELLEASIAADRAATIARRRRLRRLRWLTAATTIFALLAVVLAGVADRSRSDAVLARDQAESRQIALVARQLAGSDASVAAHLALAAYRISPTADARAVLLETAVGARPERHLGGAGSGAPTRGSAQGPFPTRPI